VAARRADASWAKVSHVVIADANGNGNFIRARSRICNRGLGRRELRKAKGSRLVSAIDKKEEQPRNDRSVSPGTFPYRFSRRASQQDGHRRVSVAMLSPSSIVKIDCLTPIMRPMRAKRLF